MKNSELIRLAMSKGMKIGNTDIETSPDLSWHYSNHDVYIDPIYTEAHTQITSIALKDLKTGKVIVKGWDYPKNNKYGFLKPDKDKQLLKTMVPKLQKYDILIGQNHKSFDVRKINWRLCQLELPPLPNLILIDTLKESQKTLYSPNHRLNFKSHIYGLGGKIKQDMSDCVAVAKGDLAKTKERMLYNIKDVDDDDAVFWREIDYYILPKMLINLLKMFISNPKRTYCLQCAAAKNARFNISKTKIKKGYKFTCQTCDSTWNMEVKDV